MKSPQQVADKRGMSGRTDAGLGRERKVVGRGWRDECPEKDSRHADQERRSSSAEAQSMRLPGSVYAESATRSNWKIRRAVRGMIEKVYYMVRVEGEH